MIPATTSQPSPGAGPAPSSASVPTYASPSLYVGDLNPEVSDSILYDHFNTVAGVESVKVCRDSSKKSLRYAYVNYRNVEDAEKAMETLNYSHIMGTPCRIMWSRPAENRRSNEGNLYVKNLDPVINTRALHDTFSLFGNILSCKVATDEQGHSKGYGFVQYETAEAAENAITELNGQMMGSKKVYVTHHQKRTDRIAEKAELFTNLYVRDFPPSWTEEALSKMFGQYGPVTSVWMPPHRKTEGGQKAGGSPLSLQSHPVFACVNFRDNADAKAALDELNGKYVDAEGLCADQEAAARIRQEELGKKQESLGEESKKEEQIAEENEATAAVEAKVVDTEAAAADNETAVVAPVTSTIYQLYVDKARDKNAPAVGKNGEKVNVFIKNLPDSVDDNGLRKIFSDFGRITSAKVMKDEEGHSKGFGFVCFTTAEEATKAIAEMHLNYYSGKPLYVGLAEQKDKRVARLRRHFTQQQQQTAWGPPRHQAFLPGAAPLQSMWKTGPGQYVPSGPGGGGPANPMMTMLYHPSAATGMLPGQIPGMPGTQMRPQTITTVASSATHPSANATTSQALQKQILGEKLFPLVYQHQPTLAGKITGMMLDMDEAELQILLNDEHELRARIDEAIKVLRAAAGGA